MSKKRKGAVGRGASKKVNRKCKNKPDLRRSQSPWSSAPAVNFDAEFLARVKKDADRLEATVEDDRLWFEANPHRQYHAREATPHESYVSGQSDWVLVVRIAHGNRLRLPFKLIMEDGFDVAACDNDATGAEIFERFKQDIANSDPAFFGVLEKLQGVRHGTR
jgi:hypothetical protein